MADQVLSGCSSRAKERWEEGEGPRERGISDAIWLTETLQHPPRGKGGMDALLPVWRERKREREGGGRLERKEECKSHRGNGRFGCFFLQ